MELLKDSSQLNGSLLLISIADFGILLSTFVLKRDEVDDGMAAVLKN